MSAAPRPRPVPLTVLAIAALTVLNTACEARPERPPEAEIVERSQTRSFDAARPVAVVDSDGRPMGSVAFETTCQDADLVRLGLALLHHMTYAEAAVTFETVAAADPACAVAPWGIAMSYLHPLWPDVPTDAQLEQGWELLESARSLRTASPREQAYIEALSAYYRDASARSEAERLKTYSEAWRSVALEYPDDPEAALFSALAVIGETMGVGERAEERLSAGLMAEQVLEAIPDHPGAHHYVIHAYDVPVAAERALPAARNYGRVAPANSHALHMTSHIFTRRGLWEESIEYNRQAADAAWDEPIAGQTSHHHLHAIDYLAYAHLQRGADDEAGAVLRHVRSLTGPVVNHAASAYAFAAVPARYALERHAWEEAASVRPRTPGTIPWDSYPFLEAIPVFARAIGAARTGDVATARKGARRLEALELSSAAVSGTYDWATQVRVQEVSVRAWIAYAEGRGVEAIALMTEAADLEAGTEKNPVTPGEVLPAGELLGDMLLEAGRAEEALEAYERAMERTPNRFNSLFGAARAAEAAGTTEAAVQYYRSLIDLADGAESRRAELDRARAFLDGT